jgi:glycosylphosphatidylinositol transamidase (GPIT) subunit GPI8
MRAVEIYHHTEFHENLLEMLKKKGQIQDKATSCLQMAIDEEKQTPYIAIALVLILVWIMMTSRWGTSRLPPAGAHVA